MVVVVGDPEKRRIWLPLVVRVAATIGRSELVAVQTPQAFAADVLRRAHESGGDATDDASLVEAMGGTVVVVAGEPENMNIRLPHDLRVAETWLR